MELVWLGLPSVKLRSVRVTAREQLFWRQWTNVQWGEQGVQELQGVREYAGRCRRCGKKQRKRVVALQSLKERRD